MNTINLGLIVKVMLCKVGHSNQTLLFCKQTKEEK